MKLARLNFRQFTVGLLYFGYAMSCNTTSSEKLSPSSQLAAAVTLPPCDFTLDIIEDHKTNPLLVDEPGALAAPPDMRHDLDVTSSALMTTPLEYEKSITTAANKPKKFAAATVLAAMRRLRRFYNTRPYESIAGQRIRVTVPNSCARAASEAKSTNQNYLNTPIDDIADAWNTDGDGAMGGNLLSMPSHWNDIQAHFFPMSPHTRHGCWTMMLNSRQCSKLDYFVQGVQLPLSEHRMALANICSGNRILQNEYATACDKAKIALTVIPHHMSVYNLLWVDPVARKFINPPSEAKFKSLGLQAGFVTDAIAELESVKWSQQQRKEGYVNVWDYVMTQRLYAWDWEQQQAVLNEYFGDSKYWATVKEADRATTPRESVAIDVNDPKDCAKWRGLRFNDPIDGTHCKVDKVFSSKIQAIGR